MISCDDNTCVLSCGHCACLEVMYLIMLKKQLQIDSDTQCMNNYCYFNYDATLIKRFTIILG